MKKIFVSFCLIFLSFLLANGATFATDSIPIKGGKLPTINLQVPKNPDEKTYLGLSSGGYFRIPQIKAQAVLVKIFNLYCPICQSTAAAMIEIYHQIENNPNLKDKIKLIGIGAGNSLLEVEVFKQNHHIPFPIFPDENFKIHQALGEVRTPFFIAIKMEKDGSHEIVHTHLGGITNARGLLDLMVESYGIKEEDLLIKEAVSSPTEYLSK